MSRALQVASQAALILIAGIAVGAIVTFKACTSHVRDSVREDTARRASVNRVEAATADQKVEADGGTAKKLSDLEEVNDRLRRQVAALEAAIATARRAPPEKPAEHAAAAVTVIDTTFRVTEQNKSWWRIAWICRARNDSDSPVKFRVDVVLHDSAGFTIADDRSTQTTLAARDVQEISGSDLVDSSVAANITGAKATIDLD